MMKVQFDINDGSRVTLLRTLNTEKIFREETGSELNAQLGELAYHLEDVAKKSEEDEKAVYSGLLDLEFMETRDLVLRFMYAEVNEEGIFVQNERTRKNFDDLEFSRTQALQLFFQNI